MRSTALLLSATALLSAVLNASPLERNTVVFAEPNVQAVLSDSPTDLWQQSFQAESSVDEYWDEQDELATGDGDDDDEGSTGTGHLSQWSRQNKVRQYSSMTPLDPPAERANTYAGLMRARSND